MMNEFEDMPILSPQMNEMEEFEELILPNKMPSTPKMPSKVCNSSLNKNNF